MPFKALLNGKPFYSEELTEENRRQDYACPFCPIGFIPVIPKLDIIKHFRHKPGGKAHGEPDGPEHRAMKKAVKEGANHSSPNAGYPEAAFAGTLGVKLGGPDSYFGRLVPKPYIGIRFGQTTINHIKKACDLMILSSLLWICILCGILTGCRILF